jgi:hypothetical protein
LLVHKLSGPQRPKILFEEGNGTQKPAGANNRTRRRGRSQNRRTKQGRKEKKERNKQPDRTENKNTTTEAQTNQGHKKNKERKATAKQHTPHRTTRRRRSKPNDPPQQQRRHQRIPVFCAHEGRTARATQPLKRRNARLRAHANHNRAEPAELHRWGLAVCRVGRAGAENAPKRRNAPGHKPSSCSLRAHPKHGSNPFFGMPRVSKLRRQEDMCGHMQLFFLCRAQNG